MSATVTASTRKYRGLSANERRQQREQRLLDAGLELFGTRGYAATSVRAVSAQAELNSRYFYESFPDREALLLAVYERIIHEVALAVASATANSRSVEEQARSGLRASWGLFTADRRKARVLAIEVVGVSDRLERLRRAYRHAFADLLVHNSLLIAGESAGARLDPVLISRALMAANIDILVDWLSGEVEQSTEAIVEHFTQLFTVGVAVAVSSGEVASLQRALSAPADLDWRVGPAEVRLAEARALAMGNQD